MDDDLFPEARALAGLLRDPKNEDEPHMKAREPMIKAPYKQGVLQTLLSALPEIRTLSMNQLLALSKGVTRVSLEDEGVIYEDRSKVEYVYVCEEGEVEVSIRTSDNDGFTTKRRIKRSVCPGEAITSLSTLAYALCSDDARNYGRAVSDGGGTVLRVNLRILRANANSAFLARLAVTKLGAQLDVLADYGIGDKFFAKRLDGHAGASGGTHVQGGQAAAGVPGAVGESVSGAEGVSVSGAEGESVSGASGTLDASAAEEEKVGSDFIKLLGYTDRLQPRCKVRHYAPGDVLEPETVGMIMQGKVEMIDEEGKDSYRLTTMCQGDVYGIRDALRLKRSSKKYKHKCKTAVTTSQVATAWLRDDMEETEVENMAKLFFQKISSFAWIIDGKYTPQELSVDNVARMLNKLERAPQKPQQPWMHVGSVYALSGTDSQVETVTKGLKRVLRGANNENDVVVLDKDKVETWLGGTVDQEEYRVQSFLQSLCFSHHYVLLVTDKRLTTWSRICLRQAEYVLDLYESNSRKNLTGDDISVLHRYNPAADRILVMLHSSATGKLTGMQEVLSERDWNGNIMHIMDEVEPIGLSAKEKREAYRCTDICRLARMLASQGFGCVLAGGGAKCAPMAGMLEVMKKRSIPVDELSGCSMGSLIAASYCLHRGEMGKVMSDLRYTFRELGNHPKMILSAFSPSAMLQNTLFNSSVLDKTLKAVFKDATFSDLWYPLSISTTNASTKTEKLISAGLVWKAVRQSMSWHALFPALPDPEGNPLFDGSHVNNLPINALVNGGKVRSIVAMDVEESETGMTATEQKLNAVLTVKRIVKQVLGLQRTTAGPTESEWMSRIGSASVTRIPASLRDYEMLAVSTLPVGSYSPTDFGELTALVSLGRRFARKLLGQGQTQGPDSVKETAAEDDSREDGSSRTEEETPASTSRQQTASKDKPWLDPFHNIQMRQTAATAPSSSARAENGSSKRKSGDQKTMMNSGSSAAQKSGGAKRRSRIKSPVSRAESCAAKRKKNTATTSSGASAESAGNRKTKTASFTARAEGGRESQNSVVSSSADQDSSEVDNTAEKKEKRRKK